MIRTVISTADVRNAVNAYVTPTVKRDMDLTPVTTHAWVSVTDYSLAYISEGVTEYARPEI